MFTLRSASTDVDRSPELAGKGLTSHDALGRSRDEPVGSQVQAGGSDRDNFSDELNSKFRSQCLHSSSSSSSSSYETSSPLLTTRTQPRSPLLSRSPSTNNPFPTSQLLDGQSGSVVTLPKARTPLVPRDSIQLVKKHFSQPQPSLDRLHHLNVNIDITTPSSTSSTLKSTSTTTSPFSQFIEETDIDDGLLDGMDGVEEGPQSGELAQDGVSFVGLAEELEQLDPEAVKPPTPPLHRFPSWVTDTHTQSLFFLMISKIQF